MPDEHINLDEQINIAPHPPRVDSDTYLKSREWLQNIPDSCFVCHGPTDMIHPQSDTDTFQDHHGGGIYQVINKVPKLVGFNLFGLEWSLGWNADPIKVNKYIQNNNFVINALGFDTYSTQIVTTQDVMNYLDSIWNANVRLCKVHHIAMETEDSKDSNGNQGVGIHFTPFPIWLGQVTCDWSKIDMWAGTNGTVATYVKDGVNVAHVSFQHDDSTFIETHLRALRDKGEHKLEPDHPLSLATLKTA